MKKILLFISLFLIAGSIDCRKRYPKKYLPYQRQIKEVIVEQKEKIITPDMSISDVKARIEKAEKSGHDFVPEVISYFQSVDIIGKRHLVKMLDKVGLLTQHAKRLQRGGVPVSRSRDVFYLKQSF